MAKGGTMTISARNSHFEDGPDDLGLTGDFVTFVVADTGVGMSAEVQAQAFEPFFTTKGVGIGTGLGLSMVHDFVTQSAGVARIVSEPGQGTSVTIHLPKAQAVASKLS
jgi:signal transduction histidine kinase